MTRCTTPDICVWVVSGKDIAENFEGPEFTEGGEVEAVVGVDDFEYAATLVVGEGVEVHVVVVHVEDVAQAAGFLGCEVVLVEGLKGGIFAAHEVEVAVVGGWCMRWGFYADEMGHSHEKDEVEVGVLSGGCVEPCERLLDVLV